MNYIIYIIIIFSLFVGTNVLASFGIMGLGITLQTYLILLCAFLFISTKFNKKSFYTENKEELVALLTIVLLFCYKLMSGHKEFYAGLLNSLLAPVLLLIMLPKQNGSEVKNNIFKIIMLFFVIECGIAIIERILYINIFPATVNITDFGVSINQDKFRSSGLQNHALQNVLCIVTILLFILSSKIKNNYKLLLGLLGTFALLCFNSRSSILTWGAIFCIYLFIRVWKRSKNGFTVGCIVAIVLVPLLISIPFLLVKYNLAGRLFANELLDDSAEVRVRMLEILFDFDFTFFLQAHTQSILDDIALAMNVLAIENFWIIFLLKYGLIFLILLIIVFWKLIKKHMKSYTQFTKFYTCSAFFILASTNNSLDASGIPLTLFLLCAYSFSPNQTLQESK